MSTITASNLNDGTTTEATTYVTNGSSKAWLYGSSSAGLNDSYNISSGTDHGTGDYSYAVTSAFASANYSQTSTVATTSSDITTNRNTARSAASTLSIEIGDPHSQSNTNGAHGLTVHGDLA